jgi:hypothetical protein
VAVPSPTFSTELPLHNGKIIIVDVLIAPDTRRMQNVDGCVTIEDSRKSSTSQEPDRNIAAKRRTGAEVESNDPSSSSSDKRDYERTQN